MAVAPMHKRADRTTAAIARILPLSLSLSSRGRIPAMLIHSPYICMYVRAERAAGLSARLRRVGRMLLALLGVLGAAAAPLFVGVSLCI